MTSARCNMSPPANILFGKRSRATDRAPDAGNDEERLPRALTGGTPFGSSACVEEHENPARNSNMICPISTLTQQAVRPDVSVT